MFLDTWLYSQVKFKEWVTLCEINKCHWVKGQLIYSTFSHLILSQCIKEDNELLADTNLI